MLRPIRRHTRNCGNYGKWDVDCPSKTKLKCPLIVVHPFACTDIAPKYDRLLRRSQL
jgi:hypothetical protein